MPFTAPPNYGRQNWTKTDSVCVGPWYPYVNLLKNHKVSCKKLFENQLSVSGSNYDFSEYGLKINGLTIQTQNSLP